MDLKYVELQLSTAETSFKAEISQVLERFLKPAVEDGDQDNMCLSEQQQICKKTAETWLSAAMSKYKTACAEFFIQHELDTQQKIQENQERVARKEEAQIKKMELEPDVTVKELIAKSVEPYRKELQEVKKLLQNLQNVQAPAPVNADSTTNQEPNNNNKKKKKNKKSKDNPPENPPPDQQPPPQPVAPPQQPQQPPPAQYQNHQTAPPPQYYQKYPPLNNQYGRGGGFNSGRGRGRGGGGGGRGFSDNRNQGYQGQGQGQGGPPQEYHGGNQPYQNNNQWTGQPGRANGQWRNFNQEPPQGF
jgi:hypothetical protein